MGGRRRERGVQSQDSWKVFQLKYSLSGRTIGRLSTRTVCSVSLTLFQSGYSGPSENGEKRKRERGRERTGATKRKESNRVSPFFLAAAINSQLGWQQVRTFPLPPSRWLVNVSIPIDDRFVSRDHWWLGEEEGGGEEGRRWIGSANGLRAILFEIVRVLNYARLKIDISFWPGSLPFYGPGRSTDFSMEWVRPAKKFLPTCTVSSIISGRDYVRSARVERSARLADTWTVWLVFPAKENGPCRSG